MISETKFPKRVLSPFDNFLNIQEEMDKLLNSYYAPRQTLETEKPLWAPPVDIYENDNNFYLKVELPGMEQKDIQITLENNSLTIRGERKEEKIPSGRYYKMERFSGSFFRKFNLPPYINSENITAGYKNGVLEIVIPKSQEQKPKLINVKTD